MQMNEAATDLIGRIEVAFWSVRWPAPHELVAHDPADGPQTFKHLEEPSILRNFGGKRRHEFEMELNSGRIEELYSMSKLAVHYYLPCFLKRLLSDRNDFGFVIEMISLLNKKRFDENGHSNFWPEFTTDQRQVILETVEFVLQHIKSYHLGEFESQYRTSLQEARHQWRESSFGTSDM